MKVILFDKDPDCHGTLEIVDEPDEDVLIFRINDQCVWVDRKDAVRTLVALGERDLYDV